jgi:hypothetical protein
VSISEMDDAARTILVHGKTCDVYAGVAPRSGPKREVERVWCLWVDADDREATSRLTRFEPQPAAIQTSTPEHVRASGHCTSRSTAERVGSQMRG